MTIKLAYFYIVGYKPFFINPKVKSYAISSEWFHEIFGWNDICLFAWKVNYH